MTRQRYLVLGIAVGLVVGVWYMLGAARSVEGPETNANNVNFTIRIISGDPSLVPGDNGATIKDNTTFTVTSSDQSVRDGWDFGDREAYQCAYVEHFTDGVQDFEIHYQMVDPYPVATSGTPQITDVQGAEQQSTSLCGEGAVLGDGLAGGIAFDDTDHHPHGTSLVFYRDQDSDGRIDPMTADEFARVDYPLLCGTHYWVPGDEAGEAWLWIDPDGATDSEPGLGDCPGGVGEPYAAARAKVLNLASGVAYCVTDRMEGDLCEGLSPPAPTPIELGSGTSVLTCPDASTPAVTQTDPLLVLCP